MTTYRILDRDTGDTFQFQKASSLAAFFLGRRLGEYIVIKSDEKGDRVVNLDASNGCVLNIEAIVNDA